MEKLTFDSGIRSYRAGAGVLRFNPSDPNLYARFLQVLEELTALEQELSAADAQGSAVLSLLQGADGRIKERLSWVFGPGNDLDAVLGGVNLLAMGSNGQRVIANFLTALEPILAQGVRQCAAAEAKTLQ